MALQEGFLPRQKKSVNSTVTVNSVSLRTMTPGFFQA